MDFFSGGYTSGAWTQTYVPFFEFGKDYANFWCSDCTPITSTIYDILGVTEPNLAAASVSFHFIIPFLPPH